MMIDGHEGRLPLLRNDVLRLSFAWTEMALGSGLPSPAVSTC